MPKSGDRERTDWEGHRGPFWKDEKILNLDCSGGFMDKYGKTQTVQLKWVHLNACKLYLNRVDILKSKL